MASKYWLKLYHEMIDDPKVARLPDSSYRRFIECLLLAGELDESGFLPPIEDMAWRLRLNETSLSQDLSRLALAGMVELKQLDDNTERWFVTNFSKRQSASDAAERMREYRKRKKKEPKKKEKQIKDIDTDEDTDIDTYCSVTSAVTRVTYRNAFDAYQNEIGDLTMGISETLKSWVDDTSDQWVVDAIGIATINNKKNFAYIKAILERWMVEGKQSFDKPKTSTNGHQNGNGPHKETAEERYARLFPADHVNNQETIKR